MDFIIAPQIITQIYLIHTINPLISHNLYYYNYSMDSKIPPSSYDLLLISLSLLYLMTHASLLSRLSYLLSCELLPMSFIVCSLLLLLLFNLMTPYFITLLLIPHFILLLMALLSPFLLYSSFLISLSLFVLTHSVYSNLVAPQMFQDRILFPFLI